MKTHLDIMLKFKAVVYARAEEEMDEKLEDLLSSYPNYPKLIGYIMGISEYKRCWAVCFRLMLMTRGNDTNNFIETQVKYYANPLSK